MYRAFTGIGLLATFDSPISEVVPIVFLTDNYGWATCPRLLHGGL